MSHIEVITRESLDAEGICSTMQPQAGTTPAVSASSGPIDWASRVHEYPDLTHTLHVSGTSTYGVPAIPAKPPGPDLSLGLIVAEDLAVMPLEKRKPLLGNWMRKGDLGYLFAPRGAGKSWMAMLIGKAVAAGVSLGEWIAGEEAAPVVYFDAEMNLSDVKDRALMLDITSRNFRWLSNERLFDTLGHGINIADPAHQESLCKLLPDGCLFIIDNLSTAQIGMKENDNDSFDAVRDWVLRMRQRGITVVIVHHAGRNGCMRGGSRREDISHWVLSLKDDSDESDAGVKVFTTSFEDPTGKVRTCPISQAPNLRWTMREVDGKMTLDCRLDAGDATLLSYIAAGIDTATGLAEVTGRPIATISRHAQRLLKAGQITKEGREYRVVEKAA